MTDTWEEGRDDLDRELVETIYGLCWRPSRSFEKFSPNKVYKIRFRVFWSSMQGSDYLFEVFDYQTGKAGPVLAFSASYHDLPDNLEEYIRVEDILHDDQDFLLQKGQDIVPLFKSSTGQSYICFSVPKDEYFNVPVNELDQIMMEDFDTQIDTYLFGRQ